MTRATDAASVITGRSPKSADVPSSGLGEMPYIAIPVRTRSKRASGRVRVAGELAMCRTSGSTPAFSACATMSRNTPSWAAIEGWPGSSAQAKWDQSPVMATRPAVSAVRASATSSGQSAGWHPLRPRPVSALSWIQAAGRPRWRGDDLAQRPHAADRHVDAGLDRLAPGAARRPQPAHDPAAEPGGPQGQRLVRGRGAQPGRARLQGGLRAGHRTVPVGVGFHHGHEVRSARPRAQDAHVGAQGGEVDLGTGSQGRCLVHRAQSLRGVRRHPVTARPPARSTVCQGVSGASARAPAGRPGPGHGWRVRPSRP